MPDQVRHDGKRTALQGGLRLQLIRPTGYRRTHAVEEFGKGYMTDGQYLLAAMSNSRHLEGRSREMTWEPIWALPNIDLDEPVESPLFALVPASDPRVERLKREHGTFQTFMSRFQDAHGDRIAPALIIRRTDAPELFRELDVAASFRDLLVASTVPLARSQTIIDGPNLHRVNYSSFFWVYPWMLDQRTTKK